MGRREELTYHDLATIARLKKNGLLDCLEGFSTKTAVEATGRILTASHQRIVVGQAARLIEKMISRGGTKEDLLDAIKYGLCCLDAIVSVYEVRTLEPKKPSSS